VCGVRGATSGPKITIFRIFIEKSPLDGRGPTIRWRVWPRCGPDAWRGVQLSGGVGAVSLVCCESDKDAVPAAVDF